MDMILARATEWLAIALSLSGVGFGVWFALDNRRDLRAYRAQGWNGYAGLTAKIGVRNGVSKAILHALLAVLPALSLTAPTPPNRWLAAVIFFGVLDLAQLVVIVAQVLNRRDRLRTVATSSEETH